METDLHKLAQFMSERYGVTVNALQPAKRGFFGETWRAETNKGAYFVKIDYWDYHKPLYQNSFSVMTRMLESGIDFIPPILYGKIGETCFAFNDGVLGVFAFVEGENREDYPISMLFSRLARVYRVNTGGLVIGRENFSTAILATLARLAEQLDRAEPSEAAALRVLAEKAELLKQKAERLRLFSEKCRLKPHRLVLTHGDAGGNCIVSENRFTIIDWDDPRIAPPERDAWFFMHKPEQTTEIERAFAEQGFPYKLSADLFAYYAYYSMFYYICEYLKSLRFTGGEKKRALAQALADFFDNGWIFEQLAVADCVAAQDVESVSKDRKKTKMS